MAGRYWEEETPVVVETAKNVLRWFPRAGKLQISLPNWTDKEGSEKPGKTVTLDVEALQVSEDRERAAEMLRGVLSDLEGEEEAV